MSVFFTLTSQQAKEYRFNLFQQIHQVIFHGNGGYSWPDVYNMPIWLRNFTFSEIKKFHEESNKPDSKSDKTSTLVNADGTINAPNFKKSSEGTSKVSYK
jgi:hypothetical protein